jgi:hypothetical protein
MDAVRFDSSTRAEMLKFLFYVYRRCGAPGWFIKHLFRGLKRAGVSHFDVLFSILATVLSGSPDTNTGDTIITILVCLFLTMYVNGISSVALIMDKFSMIGMGDDGLPALHNLLRCPSPAHFLQLGYEVEIQHLESNYHIEFCSSRFWPTNSGIVLGPKPGRVMPKLGFYHHMAPKHIPATHRGTLLSMRRMVSFIPPLSAYIERQLELVVVPLRSKDLRKKPDILSFKVVDKHSPLIETWVMLDELYGWDQRFQKYWEAVLAKVTSLPAAIQFSLLDRMISVDNDFKPAINYVCSLFFDWTMVVFVSPVVEELMKCHIFGLLLILSLECIIKYIRHGVVPSVSSFIFHVFTYQFFFSDRVFMHFIWNLSMVVLSKFYGRFVFQPG